jgi:hypothetical protein
MKKYIIAVTLLIFVNTFSQSSDEKKLINAKINSSKYAIINDSIKKPGIYLNFEEFRDNNPSINLNYKIISKEEKYNAGFMKSGLLKFYAIDIPKKEGRKIGEVFGFSDGKQFYIIYDLSGDFFPNFLHNFNFNQINYVGKYCYYEIIGTSTAGNFSVPTLQIKILNLKTGERKLLTKKLLIEIISDNPELLEKFNKDENKNLNLKKYLDEYLNI